MNGHLNAGTGEIMQYYAHEFNDNTMRFVLCYPGVVDAAALSEATRALVHSVDILHASFCRDERRAWWEVHESLEEQDYFRAVQVAGAPFPAALSYAVEPIEAEAPVKLYSTLIQGKESDVVVFRVSHLIADGSDGKYLLAKLAEGYNMVLEQGSAAALAVKQGRRDPEQIYETLSKKEFRSLLRSPLTGVKSVFPFPDDAQGSARLLWRRIPANTMAVAHERVKALGGSVNDLLLAACYRSYGALDGVDAQTAMSIMGMMDLRRHCRGAETPGLANLSGSLPTVLLQGRGGSFEDTLAEIMAQTAREKQAPLAGLEGMPILHTAVRTLPIGLALKAARRVYGHMSVGLTNIGSLDSSTLQLGQLTPDFPLFGGPLKKKPSAQVAVVSLDGACSLCVAGQFTDRDVALVERWLEGMVEEIACFAGKA